MNKKQFSDIFPDWLNADVYRVQVTRKTPARHAGYLDTLEVENAVDIDETLIKARFGGGTYYLSVRDPQGKYAGHRTITIKGNPKQSGKRKRDETDELETDVYNLQNELRTIRGRLSRVEEQLQWMWSSLPHK